MCALRIAANFQNMRRNSMEVKVDNYFINFHHPFFFFLAHFYELFYSLELINHFFVSIRVISRLLKPVRAREKLPQGMEIIIIIKKKLV